MTWRQHLLRSFVFNLINLRYIPIYQSDYNTSHRCVSGIGRADQTLGGFSGLLVGMGIGQIWSRHIGVPAQRSFSVSRPSISRSRPTLAPSVVAGGPGIS